MSDYRADLVQADKADVIKGLIQALSMAIDALEGRGPHTLGHVVAVCRDAVKKAKGG